MPPAHPFLLGRQWKETGAKRPVTNPYTREVLAQVHLAGPQEIQQAIKTAQMAFESMVRLPAYLRSRVCRQVATGIEKRKEEFARTIVMESGKPLVYSRAEVARSISTFQLAAEEATRIPGELLALDINEAARNKTGVVKRFPIGPIAGISPFNFPLNLVAHKVAPALATGNPIILKPSSTTPLTALLLGKVILESEAAAGAVSILPCKSGDAAPLVEDPRIKMVTFTGSPPVGWDIKARAGKKRVALELGGNAGVILEPDADLDLAARRVCFGAFAFSGQVCISVQRTYVHESVFTPFLDKLLEQMNGLKKGDPLDPATNFGPMIDLKNAERIEDWVGEARDSGGEVLTGGRRDGAYYEPTVVTKVPPKTSLVCREAFGPVLVLEPYREFSEAIHLVNDSPFGLQAGVFTNQLDKTMKAFGQLEVGGVVINDVPTFRVDNMPYGGIKDSGFGREGIRYSIEEMTEIKLLVLSQYLD